MEKKRDTTYTMTFTKNLIDSIEKDLGENKLDEIKVYDKVKDYLQEEFERKCFEIAEDLVESRREEGKDLFLNPTAKEVPLYLNSREYAEENEEESYYYASCQANQDCKKAIVWAVENNYDIDSVLENFTDERIAYVLANTIQARKDQVRSYSPKIKEWADSIHVFHEPESIMEFSSAIYLGPFADLFLKHLDEKGPDERKRIANILNGEE